MASNKAPAFQFYVKDWLSDPQLRQVCATTKGVWIDVLCFMWTAPERGVLSGTKEGFIRMVGCLESEFEIFIDDAKRTNFCDVSVTCHGDVTLMSRRMMSEEQARENSRLRKRRSRVTKMSQPCHKNVTPHLQTASSSAVKSLSKDKQSEVALTVPKNQDKNGCKSSNFGGDKKHFSSHIGEFKNRIIKTCKRLDILSARNGKRMNGWEWVQQKANQRGHPQAIVESLEYIAEHWDDTRKPWGYAEAAFKSKQPKYSERDHIADSQKFKDLWMSDDMLKIVGNVGKRI